MRSIQTPTTATPPDRRDELLVPRARTLPAPGHVVARRALSELLYAADGIGERMALHIHERIPEFRETGPETLAQTVATCRAHVEAKLGGLIAGLPSTAMTLPPSALAYVRALARRGVPLVVLLRAYRVGHDAMWDELLEALRAAVKDEHELVVVLDGVSAFLFDYVDAVSDELVGVYDVERERWAQSSAARRLETVTALVHGTGGDPRAAGVRLGYELERPHVGAIVVTEEVDEDVAGRRIEVAADLLAAALGGGRPLVVQVGLSEAWVWVGAPTADPRAAEALRLPPGVVATLGGSHAGPAGFARTHHDAARAAALRPRLRDGDRPVLVSADVELLAFLAPDRDLLDAFVADTLGPLAGEDRALGELRETLLAVLEHGGAAGAAAALHVHHNTVYNRLARARPLVDLDGLTGAARTTLQVALAAACRLR